MTEGEARTAFELEGLAPEPPPSATRRTARRARWEAFQDRIPLRARLVLLITVLLGAGLVLAGVTSATLLQRSLVAQIDDKLRAEGYQIAQAQASNWFEVPRPDLVNIHCAPATPCQNHGSQE